MGCRSAERSSVSREFVSSFAIALVLMGCTEDAEDGRGRQTAAIGGSAGTVMIGSTSGGFDNTEGNTESFAPPDAGADLAVRDDTGDCKIGHYEGAAEGIYSSPIIAGLPVPISTDGVGFAEAFDSGPKTPGFEFWLEGNVEETVEAVAVECDADDEFCFEEFQISADYVINGGKARGLANGLFPFEFEIRGALDCAKGEFHGLIENGWYDVFAIRYVFNGTMDASYDATNSEFFDGSWVVTEPVDPNFGGQGTWYAVWTMD